MYLKRKTQTQSDKRDGQIYRERERERERERHFGMQIVYATLNGL